jgi:hypothetical protein
MSRCAPIPPTAILPTAPASVPSACAGAPVRLTLQTNTHPRAFSVAFLSLVRLLPLLGVHVLRNQFSRVRRGAVT